MYQCMAVSNEIQYVGPLKVVTSCVFTKRVRVEICTDDEIFRIRSSQHRNLPCSASGGS